MLCSLHHAKAALCLLPPTLWIGVYKCTEKKCGPIQYSLDCPPGSILCLGSFHFVSLLLLSAISNTHAPILEHVSPVEAGPRQMLRRCGTPTDDAPTWDPDRHTASFPSCHSTSPQGCVLCLLYWVNLAVSPVLSCDCCVQFSFAWQGCLNHQFQPEIEMLSNWAEWGAEEIHTQNS